jgi:MtN3 and saliva related transmembrane protein
MTLLLANAVGTAATLCSISSFLPQVVKIARERDASSVSLRMYVITVVGFGLWSSYGLMIRSWPVLVSNLLALACAGAVLVMKLRFDRRRKA